MRNPFRTKTLQETSIAQIYILTFTRELETEELYHTTYAFSRSPDVIINTKDPAAL